MKRLIVLGFGLFLTAAVTGCCCMPSCCGGCGGCGTGCGYGGGGCGPGGCTVPGGVPAGAMYTPSCNTCTY